MKNAGVKPEDLPLPLPEKSTVKRMDENGIEDYEVN